MLLVLLLSTCSYSTIHHPSCPHLPGWSEVFQYVLSATSKSGRKAVRRHAFGLCRFMATKKKDPSTSFGSFLTKLFANSTLVTRYSQTSMTRRERTSKQMEGISITARAHQAICDRRGYREKNTRRLRTRGTQANFFKATREGLKYTAIL